MAEKVLVSPSLVDENMGALISDLQDLIRQASISAINYGLEECAEPFIKHDEQGRNQYRKIVFGSV